MNDVGQVIVNIRRRSETAKANITLAFFLAVRRYLDVQKTRQDDTH